MRQRSVFVWIFDEAIREFEFSKDLKVKEVQVVLRLLLDQEGRPIGFDVFSGNTFEGKTIKVTLNKLSKRFQMKRLIFVGDYAILSKDNIRVIVKFPVTSIIMVITS